MCVAFLGCFSQPAAVLERSVTGPAERRMSTSDAGESELRVGGVGGGGETSHTPSYGIVRAVSRIARYVHMSPKGLLLLKVGR